MQFQQDPNQCCKHPFSENRVQIGATYWLYFCLLKDTQTRTHTYRQMCSENITPPQFYENPKIKYLWCLHTTCRREVCSGMGNKLNFHDFFFFYQLWGLFSYSLLIYQVQLKARLLIDNIKVEVHAPWPLATNQTEYSIPSIGRYKILTSFFIYQNNIIFNIF